MRADFHLAANLLPSLRKQAIARAAPTFAGVRIIGIIIVPLLALIYPSPGSRDYYNYVIQSNYVSLTENFTSDESYLRHNLPGYISAQPSLTACMQMEVSRNEF